MPQRSNLFQRMVCSIQRLVHQGARVHESKLLQDRITGQEREVDVVIEVESGDFPQIISIECVDRARPADVAWVEEMWAKHFDLPTNLLILVSRAGFTNAARLKAQRWGILLEGMESVDSVGWPSILLSLKEAVVRRAYVNIVGIDLELTPIDPSKLVTPMGSQPKEFLSSEAWDQIDNLVRDASESPQINKLVHEEAEKGSVSMTFSLRPKDGLIELSGRPIVSIDGTAYKLWAVKVSLGLELRETSIPLMHSRFRRNLVTSGEANGPAGTFLVAMTEQQDGAPEYYIEERGEPERRLRLSGLVASRSGVLSKPITEGGAAPNAAPAADG